MLVGCDSQETVRAKVFERKRIEKDRLLIKFGYLVNDKAYTDSAVIKNIVIKSDSINVIIDPSNPTKGIPQITEH